MPRQLLLPGFPDGSSRIGDVLSILKKEERVTYFVGGDNYFSQLVGDAVSQRFILASLMDNGHVRACDLARAPFCIPHRTVARRLVPPTTVVSEFHSVKSSPMADWVSQRRGYWVLRLLSCYPVGGVLVFGHGSFGHAVVGCCGSGAEFVGAA